MIRTQGEEISLACGGWCRVICLTAMLGTESIALSSTCHGRGALSYVGWLGAAILRRRASRSSRQTLIAWKLHTGKLSLSQRRLLQS